MLKLLETNERYFYRKSLLQFESHIKKNYKAFIHKFYIYKTSIHKYTN